jgi:ribulose 1,5-bisphosphate synthetase/thiazole synthase
MSEGGARPARAKSFLQPNGTEMSGQLDTGVLIVGAGPVGLTLALNLASRGIDVTIVELRRAARRPA